MRPRFHFKVWIDRKEYRYFNVHIWRDKFELRKATDCHDDTVGLCRSWKVCYFGNNKPDTRLMGDIHLCNGHLGSGVVSHEFTHALFHIKRQLKISMRRGRRGVVSDGEEKLCWMMGWMISQFYTYAWKKKIFNKTNYAKHTKPKKIRR